MTLTHATQPERPVHDRVNESELSMKARLAEQLQTNGLFANYGLSCEHCEGVVVLRGWVRSFHEKQMAQELIRKVDGVKIVVNRLVVDRSRLTKDFVGEIPMKVGV